MVGIQVQGKMGILGWHLDPNYNYLRIRFFTRFYFVKWKVYKYRGNQGYQDGMLGTFYILLPMRPKTRSDIPFTRTNSSKDKVGYTFQLHQFVLRQGRIYLLVKHAVISSTCQFKLSESDYILSPIRPKTRSDIPFSCTNSS